MMVKNQYDSEGSYNYRNERAETNPKFLDHCRILLRSHSWKKALLRVQTTWWALVFSHLYDI
jgi:hypothetical protein